MLFNKESKNIPQEMQNIPQWVNWRYERRKGKQTKVPYNSRTLKHGSSTASHTWSNYATACARVSSKTGLGFVLTPPYIGVDMDHCVMDDGTPSSLAQEILARFGSTYYEWSPSETGIHLFLKGMLAHALHTKLGEIYTVGRYFTVTGRSFGGAQAIVLPVGKSDIAWLVQKLTPSPQTAGQIPQTAGQIPQTAGQIPQRSEQPIDTDDTSPIDNPLFAALSADPLWLATWRREDILQGKKGDTSDSAYEMALARRCVLANVDDQSIYKLLVQWRREQHIPVKHHKALLLTIENAHKEHVMTEKEQQQERVLDDPDAVDKSDKATHLAQLLGLPLSRIVRMGKAPATYRAHLASGEVLNLGKYKMFTSFALWKELAYEYAGKSLVVDKKRWQKIARLIEKFCEYEESADTSEIAETQVWIEEYIGNQIHCTADVVTLDQFRPFTDDSGRYLSLNDFTLRVGVRHSMRIDRIVMAGRLRVLGWVEVDVTRSDAEGKHTITRNYWHKAF